MEHLASRTTYISITDLVKSVADTHQAAADHAMGSGEPMPELERRTHQQAAGALLASLEDQDEDLLGTHLQYTRLRELEQELDEYRQNESDLSYPIWTFTKMQRLFEHAASGFDIESVADYLRSCAALEERFAKRFSLAQQLDDTYVGRP